MSDPLGILARPLRIVTRENTSKDFEVIAGIIEENGVERIIVGLPVNMDGTSGGQVEKVRGFAEELKHYTSLPIEFKDERLTTVEAKNLLHSAGKTGRDTRYDAAAAALILQSWLDDRLPPKEIPEE